MGLENKPVQYRIGYASGLHSAVVAISTRSPDGICIPNPISDKDDPNADYYVGYADGIQKGVDIMNKSKEGIL